MNATLSLIVAAGLLATPSPAASVGQAVTVELRSADGRELPFYPAPGQGGDHRVYAEAVQGSEYHIVVHNHLGRRVGLVIAVDGRNIVSGAKSWLGSGERMYILDPYGTQEYDGWRTGQDRVNRFYFTSAGDSYAAAFDDTSAMGVVAVAVYAEFQPPLPVRPHRIGCNAPAGASAAAGMAAPAPSCRAEAKKTLATPSAQDEAGTGYGPEEYSPCITVAFQPEAQAREKSFIKYEWRNTLCRMGILRNPPPVNRMWNDAGFAPPPPGRR
jgi:hypothetical protein